MIEQAYHDALAGSGAAFSEAERRLLEGGADAAAFLRERAAAEGDAITSLVARALLARTEPGGALSRALADLGEMEAEGARSARGGPDPVYVRGYLKKHYGPAVAALLGAYLSKLWPLWPGWMTAGVAMYVGEQGGPEVSETLLPLALGTPDPYQREVAARALALTGDPALSARLDARVARAPDADRDRVRVAADDVRRRIEALA